MTTINFSDTFSPCEDKGILGLPEKFDSKQSVDEKSALLAKWIAESKNVVIHTGAGISTASGIPDFRGPNGVWTLEQQGVTPVLTISFPDLLPNKTHMAIVKLIEAGYVKYLVSQNVDGLHFRSGIKRKDIGELHGNLYVLQCKVCKKQFMRNSPTLTMGQKPSGISCFSQGCSGELHDTIIDWDDDLAQDDFIMSEYYCSIADLSIIIGTTLQFAPCDKLPFLSKKTAIINLQETKFDDQVDVKIHAYSDNVMEKIMEKLGLKIPEYNPKTDIIKIPSDGTPREWNISKKDLNEMKAKYEKFKENETTTSKSNGVNGN